MKKINLWKLVLLCIFVLAFTTSCGKKEKKEKYETTLSTISFIPSTDVYVEMPDGIYNDLTGEYDEDQETEYGRPIAIMINNIGAAMPQCGIGDADIIYECVVEGGITRLMAIFNNYEAIEKVGSIRSCRPYYVTIANEYDAIYTHFGQSPQGTEELEKTNINNLSGLNSESETVFYRDSARRAPHNVFTDGDRLTSGITFKNYRTQHEDNFESKFKFNLLDGAPQNGERAYKLTTKFNSSREFWFEYNDKDYLYYRFQYNTEHIDANTGEQLKFKNIIVQFADYSVYDDHDRQKIDLVSSGTGLYASDGAVIPITWSKSSDNSQTKYYTSDGKELVLNAGKTWITIFKSANKENVTWE